ncbi:MAG: hypothetical protein HOV80_28425 [Polyangiaceae bacterium]|nr:hypothetical protein [Polyangiaceae bacterium]
MRRIATILAVTSSAVFGILAAGACSPSVEVICKRVCDCGNCSKDDEEGCVDGLEDAEKDASDEDCGSQYDEYITCLDEKVECKDGGATDEECDKEKAELADCLDAPVITFVQNGCVDLCEKVAGCSQVQVPPGTCEAAENVCTFEQNKCAACLAGGPGDLCTPEGLIDTALPCLQTCLAALECEPGSQIACQCQDGTTGTQTCNGVAYGACECEAGPPGTGGGGAGGSASGG